MNSLLACIAVAALVAGCNTAHQLASPDTVPAGATRVGNGGAVSRDPNIQGDDDESANATHGQALLWLRHGITDSTEVSAMLMFVAGAKVGVKHQILGHRDRRGFALSLGGEVAGQWAPELGDYTRTIRRVDLWLPVHLGYRMDREVSLYLSPRYASRYIWFSLGDIARSAIRQDVVGGVLGFEYGTALKVHVEVSLFRNLTGFGDQFDFGSNEGGLATGVSF